MYMFRLEERVKGVVKARPTGELARMKLPANDLIWLECIRLERRAAAGGSTKMADSLMSKALKECPHSGALWAEEVLTCPKQQQRSKCIDALKKCENDPLVLLAVARVFERDNKVNKARKWLNRFIILTYPCGCKIIAFNEIIPRAISLNPKFGDSWIYFYALEYVQLHKRALIVETGATGAGAGVSEAGSESGKGSEGTAVATANEEDEDDDDELGDAYINIPAPSGSSTSATVAGDGATSAATASEGPGGAGIGSGLVVPADSKDVLAVISEKCATASPNRGELWCSVSKETKLRRKDIPTILKAAVSRVLRLNIE